MRRRVLGIQIGRPKLRQPGFLSLVHSFILLAVNTIDEELLLSCPILGGPFHIVSYRNGTPWGTLKRRLEWW